MMMKHRAERSTRRRIPILIAMLLALVLGTGQFVSTNQSAQAAQYTDPLGCVADLWHVSPPAVMYYGYQFSYAFESYACWYPDIDFVGLPSTLSVSSVTTQVIEQQTWSASRVVSGYLQVGRHTFTVRALTGGAVAQTKLITIDVLGAPSFTPSSAITTGVTGTSYSHQFSATNNGSISAPALPSWLSYNASTRTVSGTLPSPGSYSYTMYASNPSDTAVRDVPVTVIAPPVYFTQVSPPGGVVDAQYSYEFRAEGSTSITAPSGFLTTGLTFTPGVTTATLTGKPTLSGTSVFVVRAQNASGIYVDQQVNVTIAPATAPTSFSAATPEPFVLSGAAYPAYQFVANGSPAPTYELIGSIPGMQLSSSGVLSGNPTATGVFSYTVRARNIGGTFDTAPQTLTVGTAPAFSAWNPPTTVLYNAFTTYTFAASGTPAPTFTLTAGPLPSGMTLSSAGVLSGTPLQSGTFSYTVRAVNPANSALYDSKQFTLTVDGTPVFANASPGTFVRGTAKTYVFTATGDPAAAFTISGTLPDGMTFTPATGTLTGTPTEPGTSPGFRIKATNSFGSVETGLLGTVVIGAPKFTTLPSAVAYTSPAFYSSTFVAAASPAATFTRVTTGGLLPGGLNLSIGGALTGSPTTAGSYTFTVRATSFTAPFTTFTTDVTMTIIVFGKPVIAPSGPSSGTVGSAFTPFTFTGTGGAITWSSTMIPPGLNLTTGGVLSGTPTTSGVYNMFVLAANPAGVTVSNVKVIVISGPLRFTASSPAATLTKDQATYSYQYLTTGSPAVTSYSYTGTLPSGLGLNASTGLLSGTPTANGVFTFTVTANNGYLPAPVTAATTITVITPVSFISSTPPPGKKGLAYDYVYTMNGYPSPTFSVVSGALPNGIHLDANTGRLSGTPDTLQTTTFVIRAQNTVDPQTMSPPVESEATITVHQVPAFEPGTPHSGLVDAPYSYIYAVTGTPAPVFSYSGTLPDGLALNATTGELKGTPVVQASFTFTVIATNIAAVATLPSTIVIGPAGVRSAYIGSAQTSSVASSAGVGTSSGALMLYAADTTESAAGWNVTVSSSEFSYHGGSGGASIPASNFMLNSLGQIISTGGQGILTGTNAAPTGPQSSSIGQVVSGLFSSPLKVLRAGPTYGNGSYKVPLNVALTVPTGAKPGLYTATLTITIASGP